MMGTTVTGTATGAANERYTFRATYSHTLAERRLVTIYGIIDSNQKARAALNTYIMENSAFFNSDGVGGKAKITSALISSTNKFVNALKTSGALKKLSSSDRGKVLVVSSWLNSYKGKSLGVAVDGYPYWEARRNASKGAESVADAPEKFELIGNYPNPFNPSTEIEYALSEDVHVKVAVYDGLGRRVAVLVNEVQSSGRYTVTLDAAQWSLSSGVYYYAVETPTESQFKSMTLVK